MSIIHPLSDPFKTWQLPVTDGHVLQIYEYGSPTAPPVVVLHGGPGGGSSPVHASVFHPQQWRVICFDQRGCGKSTGAHPLHENTTQTLLADIEHIRAVLNIEQWHVSGGSWGSTLALCYAIENPERVLGLTLRGLFIARPQDTQWLYGPDGVAQLFPEFYQQFCAQLQQASGTDLEPISAAWQVLHDAPAAANEVSAKVKQAAIAWGLWEARISTLTAKSNLMEHVCRDANCVNAARIGNHFFKHDFFLPRNYILDNLHKITHIPALLVHGRYDVVCTLSNAYELASRWPQAELRIVQDAGHSSTEPGIAKALVAAADKFAAHR